MFFQNIKHNIRSLWRYKSCSIINLAGLSIGIAAVIIIFLIVNYENSFDKYHSDNNNIYRVVSKTERADKINYQASVPYPLAKMLRNEIRGITTTEIHYVNEMNIRIGNQTPFNEKQILFADSLFFKVFDFAGIKNLWLKGNSETILNEPRKAILTESTAKRFFGNDDPMGKIIKLDNKTDVEVAGIIKDVPSTIHFPFGMIVSSPTFNKDFIGGLDIEQWGVRSHGYCYVSINDNAVKQTESALYSIVQKNAETDNDKKEKMYLQPLSAIHFDPAFETTNPSYTISPKYNRMLLLLGSFIILIACINYINLSTSLAFSKSKEVGIRKTIGASRSQLFFHYLSETLLLTFAAAIVGVIISILFLPSINQLLQKAISFNQLISAKYIAGAIVVLFIISFISGFYPALILSGFSPILSLKNQFALPGKFSTLFRKSLVVFQFTISIAIIICTIVIAKQTKYFTNKSLGFNKDAVIEVGLPVSDSGKMASFKNLLRDNPGITNISFCLGAPISDNGFNTNMQSSGLSQKKQYNIKIIPCDSNYLNTYEIKLVAGRWFLPGEENLKDSANAIVVNQALVKTLGYRNPEDAIGKKITIGINDLTLPIIGVTQDFNTTSLHQSISPVGLMPFSFFYYSAGIRFNPSDIKQTLAGIETAWKKVYPESVYQFKFTDETLAKKYSQETKDYNLFKAFSVISIFICCIGLWGLIAFVVARKTREIGIRKVLGASVNGIVFLLSKDFLMLVAIALLIASPIAWFFMNKWLQDFAYRINISWWIFILAGAVALVIALLTVSFQAIKAAIANPVKNLRTE